LGGDFYFDAECGIIGCVLDIIATDFPGAETAAVQTTGAAGLAHPTTPDKSVSARPPFQPVPPAPESPQAVAPFPYFRPAAGSQEKHSELAPQPKLKTQVYKEKHNFTFTSFSPKKSNGRLAGHENLRTTAKQGIFPPAPRHGEMGLAAEVLYSADDSCGGKSVDGASPAFNLSAMNERRSRFARSLLALGGVGAFATILAFHNITDGDLWAKLALGETVCATGRVPLHNVCAFTPVLPEYIDHEWASGVVFYTLLRWLGPSGLMLLKIALALGALGCAFLTGRRQGDGVNLLLLLSLPAAACLLPGYIPVVRCHAFTFFFFAATLFVLEELWQGRRWPAIVLPLLIMAWANLHGGFVVGLAVIFLYCAVGCLLRKTPWTMVLTAAACAAVTLLNPYGLAFWRYLVPALLHPRARIAEWRPLPLLAWDDFWGFRLLFVLTILALAAGWQLAARKNLLGLAVLVLTAWLGWRSRRHGPFFAVAALAFAGPYFAASLARLIGRWKIPPLVPLGVLYGAIALFVSVRYLPAASLQPLAPVGQDPVREVDILARAAATGRVATPFAWGSYVAWRLYPSVQISMDGRYESAYPESTFALNNDFFDHHGDWFRLAREYKVDYVILDLQQESLRPEDLTAKGYVLIWRRENVSALCCLPEHAARLRQAAATLPATTIDPLDLRSRPAVVARNYQKVDAKNDLRQIPSKE